jgi:hypothetical protein
MGEDISLDIKKPRDMSVQDFVQRLNHLNDLMDFTSIPDPINNSSVQTLKFTDVETQQAGKRHKKKDCEEKNNLSTRVSDEASSSSSETNQIEENFQIQDIKINPKDNISTEVRIQCFSKNVQHLLLGLLDTGATGIFIS